jgi:hypothetical protein
MRGSVLGDVAAITQNCCGVVCSHPEPTAYAKSAGDFLSGIRQMLKRWEATYPLNPANPDVNATHNGGSGLHGQSLVINCAINQGSLIDTMRVTAVPASVSTYPLCCNSPTIPDWNNATDGPSDGTNFLTSRTDTGGIGTVASGRFGDALAQPPAAAVGLSLGQQGHHLARISPQPISSASRGLRLPARGRLQRSSAPPDQDAPKRPTRNESA